MKVGFISLGCSKNLIDTEVTIGIFKKNKFEIVNDETKAVEVILDKDLFKEEKIGVHPGVNTATVIITPNDLEKYIRENGNKLKISVL